MNGLLFKSTNPDPYISKYCIFDSTDMSHGEDINTDNKNMKVILLRCIGFMIKYIIRPAKVKAAINTCVRIVKENRTAGRIFDFSSCRSNSPKSNVIKLIASI